MSNRIEKRWQEFQDVAPPGASPSEIEAMRSCFYTGAMAALMEAHAIMMSDDDCDEDKAYDEFQGMIEEIMTWFRREKTAVPNREIHAHSGGRRSR